MEVELVAALEKAASPVPSQRQVGEQEIKQLEKNSGFHVALLSIYGNDQVSMSSRYLAIIYLKNATEQKWRQSVTFSSEEKDVLRAQLIPSLLSPVTTGSRQMAKQLAVIIASIARADFPRKWPDLLMELNQKVVDAANSGDVDRLDAALEAMHQTLKRLATARIGLSRVKLNEFSVQQVELYWQIFTAFKRYNALKIVGTLLYDGDDRIHRFPGPHSVFANLFPLLKNGNDDFKIVCRIGKIYERLVDKHPLVFCGFKQDAAAVVQFYCEYLASRPSLASGSGGTRPIVQAMSIVRDLTRLANTQERAESSLPLNLRPRNDLDRQDLQDAYAMCASVFSESTITHIVDALIQFYFQMSMEDVELWQDDPAEYVVEESRQNPEFSVVLCAEMLFAHILKSWPQLVAPRAQNLIEQAVQSGEELKVEAALRALQFGASTFSQSFKIEPIIQLLTSQATTSPLICRRICLVVGGWIPVANDNKLQAIAFELVKKTLDGNWDIVVQLGALELTRICCDDLDFQPQYFAIAADSIFTAIYRLLRDHEQSTEVKLQVLRDLGTVVEGLGSNMNPINTDQILEILPALWTAETEHSNHHLIQGSVLQALANLITACGTASLESVEKCYRVALPLVDIATDPSQPLSSYLLEDGLSVWKSLLVNAPQSASESLAPLFGRVLQLIETKTEELGSLLSILESYLWLDPSLATPHYNKLFGLFSLYLSEGVALDEALLILLCTEVAVMLSGRVANSQLIESMQQTGLLEWMEACVLRAGQEDANMDTMLQASKCINILSFISIQTSGQGIPHSQELFPSWLNRIRGIGDPRDKKLGCMGVTALLLAHPELFNQFSAQFVEVMGTTVEEIPDTAKFSRFYSAPEDDKLTAEEQRQRDARSNEIAVAVGLQAFIKDVAEYTRMQGLPEFAAISSQMGIIAP